MKRLLFVLMLMTVCAVSSYAQECMGFNFKAGSGFEMNSMDGKGKSIGKIIYKIASVTKEGATTVITVDFESINTKGKSDFKNTYKMRCDGNALTMDAGALINPEQMKSFESFQMKFTSTDLVYPVKLSVGDKLKDASLKGEGMSGPMAVVFNMLIINRKVEGQEKITTPAGTYDTFKITSDMNMETKMGFGIKMEFQTVSYRAPGIIWDIKSETYRKGKLVGTTELVKIY